MKFHITKILLPITFLITVFTNTASATDVYAVYIRLPLLDWDRFYAMILSECQKYHPETVPAIRKRIQGWHEKNDETIAKIVKYYETYPESLGDIPLEESRVKINQFMIRPFDDFEDWKKEDTCLAIPFDREEYIDLLEGLVKEYGEI